MLNSFMIARANPAYRHPLFSALPNSVLNQTVRPAKTFPPLVAAKSLREIPSARRRSTPVLRRSSALLLAQSGGTGLHFFALFCSFLHSAEIYALYFQPIPRSLRKTPGSGMPRRRAYHQQPRTFSEGIATALSHSLATCFCAFLAQSQAMPALFLQFIAVFCAQQKRIFFIFNRFQARCRKTGGWGCQNAPIPSGP
jgi:hypothetical protein